jgi:hypothetical protein
VRALVSKVLKTIYVYVHVRTYVLLSPSDVRGVGADVLTGRVPYVFLECEEVFACHYSEYLDPSLYDDGTANPGRADTIHPACVHQSCICVST